MALNVSEVGPSYDIKSVLERPLPYTTVSRRAQIKLYRDNDRKTLFKHAGPVNFS